MFYEFLSNTCTLTFSPALTISQSSGMTINPFALTIDRNIPDP
jgi:hypothetical protein